MDLDSSPYAFLTQVEPWGLSQVYLPFALYLFTHNFWFTLCMVFLTKSFESIMYLLAGGFFIFSIGEGDRLETRNDSWIGDPLSALIGIAAAWYISHLFQSGRIIAGPWTPANFKLHSGYYIRNIIGVVLIVISSLFLSYDYHHEMGQCGTPLGVIIYFGAGLAIILALYYSNRNPTDLQWVWSHPPAPKRFSLRSRYNATYGMWLAAHVVSSACFLCTWNSSFVMAFSSAIGVFVLSTITWLIVDHTYRKGEGENFSLYNFFNTFAPQWGPLGDVTSDTLAIPGPASYSAIPSLRGDTPGFLMVDRPLAYDPESGMPSYANTNTNIFSSGLLLPHNLQQQTASVPPKEQPPMPGGAAL